ncbi:hypothetical protein GLYMA_05G160533v4 [Glycine max]|nr:hypothetical protein GLYMA_05G160533v4 [Glycine max]KAH1134694.1 hypothetical protein GYH30_012829 [Glycine max]
MCVIFSLLVVLWVHYRASSLWQVPTSYAILYVCAICQRRFAQQFSCNSFLI